MCWERNKCSKQKQHKKSCCQLLCISSLINQREEISTGGQGLHVGDSQVSLSLSLWVCVWLNKSGVFLLSRTYKGFVWTGWSSVNMRVTPSIFACKIKHAADGLRAKLKARFCIRGDKEIEGVDYWKTCAPVVNWNTIRLFLILVAQLELSSTQVDCAAAFTHAPIPAPIGHSMRRTKHSHR